MSIGIVNYQIDLKKQKLVLRGLSISAGRKPARWKCMYEAEKAISFGCDKYGGYKLSFLMLCGWAAIAPFLAVELGLEFISK